LNKQQMMLSLVLLRPPASQLCWPPAIMFYRCSLDLFLFSLPDLQGRLADRQQTLPHVRWSPRFMKFSEKFGCPLSLKFGGPKTSKFGQLRDFITNISGTQQDIVSRKTALQTADTVAQTYLIWCTLVHKRLK